MDENLVISFGGDTVNYDRVVRINPNPSATAFRLHSHNMHEIYYFHRGNADFSLEGTRYPLQRGMLVISPSGQVHHLTIHDASVPYERTVIMFAIGLLPPSLEEALFSPPGKKRVFLLNERERIWFEETCLGIEQSNSGEALLKESLSALIRILFAKLSTISEEKGVADPKTNDVVNQIVRFVGENLTAPLSLEIIEKNLYRDKAHLNRVFKSAMGCSIWDYVIQKRVYNARSVLLRTGSVSAAFEASGFGDYSVFYRNYTRCAGRSPSADLNFFTKQNSTKQNNKK